MDSRTLTRDEGPDDCGVATSAGRFRRTIAGLEKSLAVETRRAPFTRSSPGRRTDPGDRASKDARLSTGDGAGTLLRRNGPSEDDRRLALLSVADARDKHLAWAEREFHRGGDPAKSPMHVALTSLPALAGSEAARRLHIAAGVLYRGLRTPFGLMKVRGFDCGPLDARNTARTGKPKPRRRKDETP